jgi:putative hydrolase of the HAD superfamily
MEIRAILFDADGVIQKTAETFIPRLKSLITETEQVDRFIAEVFEAEKPCLMGQKDFAEELGVVLSRWNVKTSTQEALKIWESIDPVPEVVSQIPSIRKYGILCYLATNQQSYRANYMRAAFNYDALFDGAFYSYELGAVKPEKSYFQNILSQLEIPSSEIVFVDDKIANVEMAQACGMKTLQFEAKSFDNPGEVFCNALNTLDIHYT